MSCTGRFFEGDAAQMWESLTYYLSETPQDADLYYGHEYSFQNLQYAMFVEPENQNIQDKFASTTQKLEYLNPNVPCKLSEEIKINPFL